MTAAVPMRRSQGTATAGEATAAELFAAHYPRLAGWIRRLVDDDETAHEIASEAFTRLLSRWQRVDGPAGYLYVIAANLVRDHWRRAERERRALRSERDRSGGAEPATEGADAGLDLRSLVTSLPDRLRVPVLLYYYADLPIADIAHLLGRPQGTVKSDLSQARQALRQAWDGAR
jgi:RNA polymerase sigma-70 factor (ECF subfamily)